MLELATEHLIESVTALVQHCEKDDAISLQSMYMTHVVGDPLTTGDYLRADGRNSGKTRSMSWELFKTALIKEWI